MRDFNSACFIYNRSSILHISLAALFLTGCAQEFTPTQATPMRNNVSVNHITSERPVKNIKITDVEASKSDSGKLSQCTRELEALKTFNNNKYNDYKLELSKIKQTSVSYLGVASGISEDINDLVRPKLQYALTNLCYRIKNDLSESMIKQVSIHD
ncbi:TPA: hypothetical protein N3282_004449 [Klebsiella aerogenes]|nr:hypothetical protein [Klebsiella aerogenes]